MKAASCQTSLDAFHELTLGGVQPLEDAFERMSEGCRETVVLKFPAFVLAILADVETDTVEVRCQEVNTVDLSELNCISTLRPWSGLKGKSFGWGWVTINQQGYQDGVLLSFAGLEPSVMLTAAASSLRIYALSESVSEQA